jgi:mycothiol synthase
MVTDIEIVRNVDDRLIAAARTTMEATLVAELRDDRFGASWVSEVTSSPFVGALAWAGKLPIGYLGGIVDDGTIRLDGLTPDGNNGLLGELLGVVLETLAGLEIHRVELWAKPAQSQHEAAAELHGFKPLRALHQMRCRLPVSADVVPTRGFVTGQDDDALLRVNNRAFASHPDQGNMTKADLVAASEEEWFQPEGIRLFEVDGQLAGFCWTKIHQQPELGEIYAIGIDPSQHGRGFGVPMTAAGLQWLTDQGLDTGMLYVEADNEPALRTYATLGFTVLRTDRAWVRLFESDTNR